VRKVFYTVPSRLIGHRLRVRMALLEAQAQGCPVVAGGYGGVPDVVRDGLTGRVTAPGDADALAGAIRELAADPAARAAMAAAALVFAREERSLARAAAHLRDTLRDTLGACLA
jgi:glycosyltransferase involved in cell wall biosynthesis